MSLSTFVAIIEEISAQLVLARPESPSEISVLAQLLDELRKRAEGVGDERLAALANTCRDELALECEDDGLVAAQRALESASKTIVIMQSHISATKQVAKDDDAVGDEVRLPEWVEEKTFFDFLAAQKYAIDEIESNILELEKGRSETLIALRRRVHTAKGEAGAVGQEQIEQVFHAMEDVLETLPPIPPPRCIDYLLVLKDWLGLALDRLREKKGPSETADELLARASAFIATGTRKLHDGIGARQIHRDSVTKHLIAEFLNDAADDLARADQHLVTIEQGGGDSETIHGLFRIFHTHKGIAGFLGLNDIVNLAHATEALLNLVREGSIQLVGEYLEVIFAATDWLRRLIGIVRQCLDGGWEVEPVADLEQFLIRIAKLPKIRASVESGSTMTNSHSPGETISRSNPAEAVLPSVAEAMASSSVQDIVPIRETVRVDLAHVDSLVELIGELMIIESMVLNSPELSEVSSLRFKGHVNQLAKISRDLQRSGMQLRMVPVRGIFQKMSRLLRDLSRKSGKEIRLHILGEGTEMDRSMVEQLADPLIHLIRNAADHGLESPEERVRRGKPVQGEIHLEARHEGGSIAIEVRDDGRGLDRAAIAKKALDKGLITEESQLGDTELQRLLFLPGFSTAKQVSEISGRGVGLDVVKKNVESMRGRILVNSTPGQGTAFKLVLPLTLAIIDGMLIGCGTEKYIIPTLSIVESIKPMEAMVKTVAGQREIIDIRGEIFALFRLGELFQISNAQLDPTQGIVIVIESFGRKVALLVDEVITQQQVVIKGAGDHISTRDYFSGATILADGRVGLILNAHELCNQGERLHREHRDRSWTNQHPLEQKQR